MRKRYLVISAAVVTLLFMGSGCEMSDITDILQIAGGSQNVTPVDVIQHDLPKEFGGTGTTGDKDKDRLIETAETMDDIKKASDLEDKAHEAEGKKPPDLDEARKELEDAAKVRPNDWSLQNQLATLNVEQGKPAGDGYDKGVNRCKDIKDSDANDRCFEALENDRRVGLEAAVQRVKSQGKTPSCYLYALLGGVYKQLGIKKSGYSAFNNSPAYDYNYNDYSYKGNGLYTMVRAKACTQDANTKLLPDDLKYPKQNDAGSN